MDDLLREAIADAKAVRETALANAKIALEEAFTPRLQSMLSKKIAAEAEDAEENELDAEEGDYEETSHDAEENELDSEENELDAEELDAEESEDEVSEEEDAEESDHEEMREEEETEESDDEMRESEDAEEEDSVEEAEDAEEEDELDLESVLRELEADLDDEDNVEEAEDAEEEDTVDENDVSSDIGKSDNKVNPEANDSSKTGAPGPEGEGSDKKAGDELGDHETVDDLTEAEDAEEGDLDLDEVLRALTEEEDAEEEADKVEELQKEIKEYRKVINFMRTNLNEVNLLNAKLLFSNKLFRAFGLNNNQKLKVVETFDRTKNLREVKLVYATLAEQFKRPTSKLVESKGSSSKAVRSTKPVKQEVLSEGAELRNRFKKLANIL
jgi:hypothetical protein